MKISPRMMICPAFVQYSAVFCVTSPVTVVAEVAVNRASVKGVKSSPWWENGSISRIVPASISPAKT